MKKVHLIGAGPGDIELLTIKAHKLIKEAEVIVFDRLANSKILELAPKCCKFIDVGKTDGHHPVKQDEINKILYTLTNKYDNIVRLKGGDPFVFGRGGEEALYLKNRGIEFDIIPGISSSVAVPAYAGIPITQRGITSSFRVITGHECKKCKSQINWESFKTDETLVFLMGLHNIRKIAKNLIKIGKEVTLPIAVISKGTTSEQIVVVGTLENIVEKAKGLPTPALIVVGNVVNLREELNWFK
ncbi:uroporphyrinogen-III C-methyltransferase [Halarcobacter bivalviorum]|uniref:uroporphyrinogen-III C-methyltransferase n=1 Tax=Halarcobacter bivalviorum TaxID=663364 RepID=A0AAX2AAC5_9BACT|nr:uroporphyrinogen-III C-methyltransferase [Halarcobacter bivalviorum]AXH12667.1 uroporphyrinogen-III (C7)-methyltransferase [Halarcobacter bivalviorum]RXK10409.1 uroporphyrinogen-III C-methyltransferase [Halarcobacter bivalviorum]